MFVSHDLGIG